MNRNLFDQMYDKINELQVQSAMEKEEMLKLCDMMMIRQTNIIVDNQAINVKLAKQEAQTDQNMKDIAATLDELN